MDKYESMDDEQAALSRLLGCDTVATPATVKAATIWLLSKVRKDLADRPLSGEQVYMTAGEVAKRYGVCRSQANVWLARLRALDKVRIQVPLAGPSDKGSTLYYLPDIEAAFTENALRLQAQQQA